MSLFAEPLTFQAEAEDPPEAEDDEHGDLQLLVQQAELDPEQDDYFRFTDVDGERAFFRAAETALIEIPEWVLDSRLSPEGDDPDEESDDTASATDSIH